MWSLPVFSFQIYLQVSENILEIIGEENEVDTLNAKTRDSTCTECAICAPTPFQATHKSLAMKHATDSVEIGTQISSVDKI